MLGFLDYSALVLVYSIYEEITLTATLQRILLISSASLWLLIKAGLKKIEAAHQFARAMSHVPSQKNKTGILTEGFDSNKSLSFTAQTRRNDLKIFGE